MIVIVDTSYAKDLAELLQNPSETSKHQLIETLCRDLRDSQRVYFITSSVKDERRVLPKHIAELSRELLDICGIRGGVWIRARRAIKIERVEHILSNVCIKSCSRIRSFAENIVTSFIGVENVCQRLGDRAVVRKIVEEDLHIVLASIYFLSTCLNTVVFTTDKELEARLRIVSERLSEIDPNHEIEVLYLTR